MHRVRWGRFVCVDIYKAQLYTHIYIYSRLRSKRTMDQACWGWFVCVAIYVFPKLSYTHIYIYVVNWGASVQNMHQACWGWFVCVDISKSQLNTHIHICSKLRSERSKCAPGMLRAIWSIILAATHCNTLQTHCNTLQHTATHCNTLQHTRHVEGDLEHHSRSVLENDSVFAHQFQQVACFPANSCE